MEIMMMMDDGAYGNYDDDGDEIMK